MKRSMMFLAAAMMMGSLSTEPIQRKIDIVSEPEWKRKKCKSCVHCGENCAPYTYKGRTIYRFSKPTGNACQEWSQKK